VPYIQIRSGADRQLKASASSCDIPLVGCALEAFKRAPKLWGWRVNSLPTE